MSVARAQQEIDAEEFIYWFAYMEENKLDTEGWEQTAVTCSVIANVAGAKTAPADFLPDKKMRKTQTSQEMVSVMESMFGGN